ncbi:hypothetical protein BpHYR1_020286 [Brachionus plicatilis]|uniref:Uncharacterized protein n=1 Tax=Brachionus plicatilis TaxID=10195 RepID=A0A3M7PB60_BRAPC|nr:hypothetical protein BpHYR1_020286 [Brachionus plicatilis]
MKPKGVKQKNQGLVTAMDNRKVANGGQFFLIFLRFYIFGEVFSSGTLFTFIFWDGLFSSKVLYHRLYASKHHLLRGSSEWLHYFLSLVYIGLHYNHIFLPRLRKRIIFFKQPIL